MRVPVHHGRITQAHVGGEVGVGGVVYIFVLTGAFLYLLFKLADYVDY